ncbi:MAG: hypothetical protein LWX83_01695 [Anaerolineae bacterium]|nr:hypothetical protein [Anaerolineae bacterium]
MGSSPNGWLFVIVMSLIVLLLGGGYVTSQWFDLNLQNNDLIKDNRICKETTSQLLLQLDDVKKQLAKADEKTNVLTSQNDKLSQNVSQLNQNLKTVQDENQLVRGQNETYKGMVGDLSKRVVEAEADQAGRSVPAPGGTGTVNASLNKLPQLNMAGFLGLSDGATPGSPEVVMLNVLIAFLLALILIGQIFIISNRFLHQHPTTPPVAGQVINPIAPQPPSYHLQVSKEEMQLIIQNRRKQS